MLADIAGEDIPVTVFPSMIGRPHGKLPQSKDYYVGCDAQKEREKFDIQCVITRGAISNWDGMEKVWQHTFDNELRISPIERPVLMICLPLGAKADREELVQITLEKIGAPAAYLDMPGLLAIYASGHTSGIVLDSGHGVTTVTPIYEGNVKRESILRVNLAGCDLMDSLMKVLNHEKGCTFTHAQREIVRKNKEDLCYVARDFEKETTNVTHDGARDKFFELQGGQAIRIGKELFECPEAFFQPQCLDVHSDVFHKMVYNTIIKFKNTSIQRDLFKSVILAGGNTFLTGFSDRMSAELRALAPSDWPTKIVPPPERHYSAWLGGSILACLETFTNHWISKEEYEQSGATIVHSKCIF